MQRINRKELVAKLLELRGATFVTVTTRTDSRAKKTGNPFGIIYKTARVNGQVNFHYDAAVLRRLEQEGKDASEFEKGESWHTPHLTSDGKLTPLSCHKDNQGVPEYLRLRHLKTHGEVVFTNEARTVLDPEEVKPFLPKPSTYKNQGTDDPVIFVVYKLESIVEIVIAGEEYVIA